MSLLGLFRRLPTSAATAKERLHFVLSHERAGRDAPDLMPRLQEDILAPIRKYVPFGPEMVTVRMARLANPSRHEGTGDLPHSPGAADPGRDYTIRARQQ